MEDLFELLAVICLFAVPLFRKKKKAQKGKEKPSAARPPKAAAQAKIPFTKDEWNAFLKDIEAQEKKPKSRPRKTPKPVKAPALVLHIDHDEPEGTVSTQGESAAEHAEHRSRLLAEEARLREEHESLQELRHMNLQKLRSAVVMSEVLGKPVSLRPRGYR